MSTSVTLNLPDELYLRAQQLAQLINREVSDILVEAISLSLQPTESIDSFNYSDEITEISSLDDEQVLTLTQLQLEPEQDQRLSQLLHRQQAGQLTDEERPQLWALMQIYQFQLLRKAQAWREAAQRNLLQENNYE